MDDEYKAKIPFEWKEREKWLDLPISIDEYKERILRLQDLMGKDKIDCIVVYGGQSDKANLQYICGYDSWWGDTMVFIPHNSENLIFVTNAIFHGELAHSGMHTHWIKDIRWVLHPHSAETPKNIADLIADIIIEKGHSTGRVAIANDAKVPYYLMKKLTGLLSQVDFIPGAPYMSKLRRKKSLAEINLFRRACNATDAAINKALDKLQVGMTERELYTVLAEEAFAKGAHNFIAHVAFGAKSCIKNTVVPSDNNRIEEGDIVSMDVISSVFGYNTDTHRNAMIGHPKNDLVLRMMNAVLEAGLKVLEKTGPGVIIYDLQKVMYSHMEKEGMLEYDFTKSLFAHGCGLDVVEEPYFYWGNRAKLEPGMTFYLEPCLVKHGVGTACWENLILITENDCERLSKAKDKNW